MSVFTRGPYGRLAVVLNTLSSIKAIYVHKSLFFTCYDVSLFRVFCMICIADLLFCSRISRAPYSCNIPITDSDSIMGRASAAGSGGRGFDPGPDHTKDFKNGTSGYLAWRSAL